jgi:nitroreductase/dihydropteridine reductase
VTHPIIADLSKRYTTKHYDASRKVPQETLDVLYEAMRLSPSSINSQPWKFVIVESDAAKQRFADTFANKFQFNQKHAKSASHIILFAEKTHYNREDYAKVVDKGIQDGRTKPEDRDSAFGAFAFAELNTDEHGSTLEWTKSQTYIALGNTMHTLARLGVDSTPMEGVDADLIGDLFSDQLEGYRCDVALAIGYHDEHEDYNAPLPKSRLALEDVLVVL